MNGITFHMKAIASSTTFAMRKSHPLHWKIKSWNAWYWTNPTPSALDVVKREVSLILEKIK